MLQQLLNRTFKASYSGRWKLTPSPHTKDVFMILPPEIKNVQKDHRSFLPPQVATKIGSCYPVTDDFP